MKLSEYVQSYRKEHHLSQRAMATKIGCSFQYISKLEKNEIECPSMFMVKKIAVGTENTLHNLLAELDDFEIYYNSTEDLTNRIADLKDELYALEKALYGIEDYHIPKSEQFYKAYETAPDNIKTAVCTLLGIEK